jgi:RNA polymerase sigma-70 factor (ECF subfamily)
MTSTRSIPARRPLFRPWPATPVEDTPPSESGTDSLHQKYIRKSAACKSQDVRTGAAERPGRAGRALTAETVYRDYGPRVYSVAWRMLVNDADAEDVTQDVLLQVVRKLDTFRGDSSLATWLHRITVNAALAHRRKLAQRRERQVSDPMDQFLADGYHAGPVRPWAAPPDEQVLSQELRQLIENAIAGLPQMYRDVYVLGDVEGLANAEIGGVLALSLPAVKSRLHRARLMMRDALAPHFEEAVA